MTRSIFFSFSLLLNGFVSLAQAPTGTIKTQKQYSRPNLPLVNSTMPGPDLTITINNIVYNAGSHTIDYVLKNSGTTSIDLKQVVLQGDIYKSDGSYVKAGGGITLATAGILNAGDLYNGRLICSGDKLFNNIAYTYRLTADHTNVIAELNETNNTASAALKGYVNPVSAATLSIPTVMATAVQPDLNITKGAMTRNPDGSYTVYYTVANSGQGALRVGVNGIRLKGEVVNNGLSMANSYIKIADNGSLLPAGGTLSGNFKTPQIIGSNFTTGEQYEYTLTVDYILDIPESNEQNNIFKINFRIGY